MHRLAIHSSSWPRRILALGGVASVALGVVLLPSAPRSLAVTHASAHGAGGSAVTVRGPRMVNPATIDENTGKASLFKHRSSVTVSQTRNLTNQTVQATWKGFTPTTAGTLPYTNTNTDYPVVVAECRVAHPRFENQCFGVDGRFGVQGGVSKFGPFNAVYTTTNARGSGVADVPLLTELQNQFLGCSPSHACSLAIIPVQGGNILQAPFSCTNHLQDAIFNGNTATANITFGVQAPRAPLCSWNDRITVPLHFAPSLANCKFKTADFTVLGSPMTARAMNQWDTGLCESSSPLFITYGSALPEPAAITSVQGGGGDVALTTRPAASLVAARHKYTYAPVAVSAVSIPYWVDNANTGETFTNMKLNPSLVTKLLTTSYNLSAVACTPSRAPNCDPGVEHNPAYILVDPEFTKLNPGINIGNTPLGNGTSANDVPIVQSGPSDMTYEVTRWIAANKNASDFLKNIPDRWGTHINSYYGGLKYPTDAFVPQDPTPQTSRAYSPVFPLSLAVADMVQAWPPGTGYRKQVCGAPGTPASYCRLTQEVPGSRVLFGVLDNADTTAFLMPSAALLNPAGRYVKPTLRSMTAALNSMTTNSDGITQTVRTNSRNPAEYPLTMVIYAMVPISGVPHAKADAIARWLRYVAGPGQVQGTTPGQLPPGYLPMTAKLRADTLKAATAVQNQTGKSTPSPSATPTSTSPAPASLSPSVSPTPSSSSVSFPSLHPKIVTVAVRDPQTAGVLRYALPVILIIGGLAALGGASSLLAPNSSAIVARLRRLYTAAGPWRRKS